MHTTTMSPGLIVLVLSLMLGLQPVTTDLYLPALPSITGHFGAAMSQAQLTLSGLLLSFGLSQLIWGPLSDRFGRRPILLTGTTFYVVASAASAAVTSMEQLIVLRCLQGAAMGAGVMCARALVRDLYAPADAARIMSKGQTGLGIIACLSAPVGSLLAEFLGWRITMLALAVFGAFALAVVALRFKETLAHKNPRALQVRTLLKTWKHIISNPTFRAFTLLSAATYGGLFCFLAASSFVFIGVLGLSKPAYGLAMFSMSFSYIIGTMMCRQLLPRFGVRRTIGMAAAASLAAGTTMGVLALMGVQNVAAIMLPIYLFMMAHGIHQPCGQSGAVGPFPHAAGTASALSGFLMMVVAFGTGTWLGYSLVNQPGSVLPLTQGVWFWTVVLALNAWTWVQRYGEQVPSAQP